MITIGAPPTRRIADAAPYLRRMAYVIDGEGYVLQVVLVPEGVPTPPEMIDVEYPPTLKRPRWDAAASRWTEGHTPVADFFKRMFS